MFFAYLTFECVSSMWWTMSSVSIKVTNMTRSIGMSNAKLPGRNHRYTVAVPTKTGWLTASIFPSKGWIWHIWNCLHPAGMTDLFHVDSWWMTDPTNMDCKTSWYWGINRHYKSRVVMMFIPSAVVLQIPDEISRTIWHDGSCLLTWRNQIACSTCTKQIPFSLDSHSLSLQVQRHCSKTWSFTSIWPTPVKWGHWPV